ncbi:MAG: ROK family protein [Myxococcaceae bacterium]|nr:ROK family protein [Myxococcaceae bacterium]
MATTGVGVDLGGTNLRAALVEIPSGKVLASVRRAHGSKAPEVVAHEVAAAIKELGAVGPCGVGVAGQLKRGLVAMAPNLNWHNVDFARLLTAELGKPVALYNDLKVAAWGEHCAGAAQGARDSLTVFVGSGVGSAQIANGQLVLGDGGVAGEIGHLKVQLEGGRRCGCGALGCLEAYAGGHNLEAWMKEEGLHGTVGDLERLALGGQDTARRLWDFASGVLGLTLANLVSQLNPGVLVLGGGVLRASPAMRARVVELIGQRATPTSQEGLRITDAALGDDSGVVGAAMLAAR